MQLGLRNVKQKVERPAVVGEARAWVVNEDYVKTLFCYVLGLCSVRVICNL